MQIKTDIAVVGSGAGGAAVAKELAKQGKDVTLIEKGQFVTDLGDLRKAFGFYDKCALRTSKEGVIVYRTLMVGGSTVASCGNGMPIMEKELKALGIDLSKELAETLFELKVQPISKKLIGKGSQLIMDVGNKLGLDMVPMPKFIETKKCISCGLCVLGCKTGAKWSSIKDVQEMQRYGGNLVTGLDVKRIVTHKGKAIGIIARSGQNEVRIRAHRVIIAAGGYGSAVILKKSGITKAGEKFFIDMLNVTYGTLPDDSVKLCQEPTMAVVSTKYLESKGFIISPFLDAPLILRTIMTLNRNFKQYRYRNLLGVMTKIKDDSIGTIDEDGSISKIPTKNDLQKLQEGHEISKRILLEAGVKEKSIFVTKPRGSHPGGTAAIGEVVNTDLMTGIENLYVCDASVLPVSSGAPPIVTIVSLAKRLAKHLR